MFKRMVKEGYSDIIIIRKVLEQIRAYFLYLECPFFEKEISEKKLLLILVEPSEERYKLMEWMMSRLEPDIDFYFPRDCHNDEEIRAAKQKDYIDAISYLKNIGLCYNRVMVPDIIHAKVSPLIQLKFLVRFLRCIRIKSWNRKPVLKKKDISQNVIENKDNDEKEIELQNNDINSEIKVSQEEIIKFTTEKINKSDRAKIILEILEHHFNADQIKHLRQKLYNSLVEKFNENLKIDDKKSSKNSVNFSDLSFVDGTVQLLLNEILSMDVLEELSLSSMVPSESYSSLTVNNDTSESICTSEFFGDVINLYNTLMRDDLNCTDGKPIMELSENDLTNVKQMSCNGDECPRSNNRIS